MKHTNKLLFFTFLLFGNIASAQDIPGFASSNYAGISGVHLQPASIADMRYKLDIDVVGLGFSLNNNVAAVSTPKVLNGAIFSPYKGGFQENFLFEDPGTGNKSAAISENVQLLSVAYRLNKNISFGISFNQRGILNVDNITPAIAHLAYSGLSNSDNLNQTKYFQHSLNGDGFNINELIWYEVGLHYAQVIKDEGPMFLKVGGSLKIENGVQAGYLYADNLSYNWKNSDTLTLRSSHVSFGQTINAPSLFTTSSLFSYLLNGSAASVAFDLGAVWEWRPDYEKFRYKENGKTYERPDKNKYRLRVGVSVLDIGSITFNKPTQVYDFVADTTQWNVHGVNLGHNHPNSPIHGIDSIVNRAWPHASSTNKTSFAYGLPTTFSVQVDYNVISDFYVNFTSFTSPRWLNVASQVSNVSYYTITPRWDSKWFGAFLPIGLNEYGQANVGLALHLGPVIIGSSQVVSFLLSNYAYGMDVYAAIKIPIYAKKATKGDECPDLTSPGGKRK